MDIAKFTLKVQRMCGKRRPMIHVLMPDGRVTEFKDRGIVLPESSDFEPDARVFALLINAEGDPFVTQDGVLAVLAVPVFGMEVRPDPEKPMSYKEVAKLIGVSLPTVKRMVGDGRLPTPSKVGSRRVVFRRSDVQLAIARLAT